MPNKLSVNIKLGLLNVRSVTKELIVNGIITDQKFKPNEFLAVKLICN